MHRIADDTRLHAAARHFARLIGFRQRRHAMIASLATVGAAIKKGKKTIYYGTTPKTCKGAWKGKAELLFAGLGGLSPQTVTVPVSLPCPKS